MQEKPEKNLIKKIDYVMTDELIKIEEKIKKINK